MIKFITNHYIAKPKFKYEKINNDFLNSIAFNLNSSTGKKENGKERG